MLSGAKHLHKFPANRKCGSFAPLRMTASFHLTSDSCRLSAFCLLLSCSSLVTCHCFIGRRLSSNFSGGRVFSTSSFLNHPRRAVSTP